MAGPLLLGICPLVQWEEYDGVETDGCVVAKHIWQRWVQEQTTEVLCVEITQGAIKYIVPVNGYHNDYRRHMYLPAHVYNEYSERDFVEVRVCKVMPPNATSITLQPIDEDLLDYDLTAATSTFLSNWNILTKHTVLHVPIPELGGLVAELFVKEVAPADTVLLRGEVPLVMDDPLLYTPKPQDFVPFSLPPPPPQTDEDKDDDDEWSMLPTGLCPPVTSYRAPFSGTGHRLGGGV
jgi:hypothetical protein